jgi:hypothetical protein
LSEDERNELLAQDEVLRNRGALLVAVKTDVVTGRIGMAHQGCSGVFVDSKVPLSGFSVRKAGGVEE